VALLDVDPFRPTFRPPSSVTLTAETRAAATPGRSFAASRRAFAHTFAHSPADAARTQEWARRSFAAQTTATGRAVRKYGPEPSPLVWLAATAAHTAPPEEVAAEAAATGEHPSGEPLSVAGNAKDPAQGDFKS
jgi:hypothetical protein